MTNYLIKKNKINLFSFCLASLIIVSCRSPKDTATLPENFTFNYFNYVDKTSDDMIAFLSFKIEQDSLDNQNKVSFLEKKELPGKLKFQDKKARFEPYLIIKTFENGIVADEMTMDHPLHWHADGVNNKNQLQYYYKELPEAEFSFRIQLKEETEKVVIIEYKGEERYNELITLDLKR